MTVGSQNGTNGTTIPVTTVGELESRLASYRTALVALVAMIKREGGWRSTADQQLIRQVERILDGSADRLDPPVTT